jgi:hypothetical protein
VGLENLKTCLTLGSLELTEKNKKIDFHFYKKRLPSGRIQSQASFQVSKADLKDKKVFNPIPNYLILKSTLILNGDRHFFTFSP